MRIAILEIIVAVRRVRGLFRILSCYYLGVLEHLCHGHGETHVLSILDGIRISCFRPASRAIYSEEQCGS